MWKTCLSVMIVAWAIIEHKPVKLLKPAEARASTMLISQSILIRNAKMAKNMSVPVSCLRNFILICAKGNNEGFLITTRHYPTGRQQAFFAESHSLEDGRRGSGKFFGLSAVRIEPAVSPIVPKIGGRASEIPKDESHLLIGKYWDTRRTIEFLKKDVSTDLGVSDIGLPRINAILHPPNINKRTANECAYGQFNNSSYLVKGGIAAAVVAITLGTIGVLLMWFSYLQRILYRQIAFYFAGLVTALIAPAVSILVTHRLIFGDWGFLFSFASPSLVFTHSLGVSI